MVDPRPQTFTDVLMRRQQDIRTIFAKDKGQQQKDVQTKPEVNVRKQGRSTPFTTNVQRYEKIAKDSEVGNSLRKIRRIKDKPGRGCSPP